MDQHNRIFKPLVSPSSAVDTGLEFWELMGLTTKKSLTEEESLRIRSACSALFAKATPLHFLEYLLLLAFRASSPRLIQDLRPQLNQALGGNEEGIPRISDRVLSQQSSDMKLIYETLVKMNAPKSSLDHSFFNKKFIFFTALLGLLCYFPIAREIILGGLIGMIGASFNEYLVHLGIGHASSAWMQRFRRAGLVGRFAEEISLAHRVHHSKMLTDFRAEFSNAETLKRVDSYLLQETKKLIKGRIDDKILEPQQGQTEIERIISEIKAGGYGVNGTPAGCISMNVLALPFFALNFIIYSYIGSIVFLVSSCFFLSAFIIQSLYSHRYLHMTAEDLETARQAGTTTTFMRWFMKTDIAKLQTRRHYRHHHEKFSYSGTANGVIMSFSFADYILRRGVKEAELSHLIRMNQEGFLQAGSTGKKSSI